MIKKLFKQMLLTQILTAMAVTLCLLIDSIMIGRYLGVDELAAYGLANPVLLVFTAIGCMLSAGIQVVCGKSMGSGDADTTNGCYSTSVFLGAAISFGGILLIYLFINPLCLLLGADAGTNVFFLTKDYLLGFIIGAPAFIGAQLMVPYMQMSGRRTALAIAVILMTICDVIFDLLNVFVFEGGIYGMGIASSLSYYVAFLFGLPYFLKKDFTFKFSLKGIRKVILAELAKAGIPTLVNQLSLCLLVFTVNQLLLSVGGSDGVAAYSVISTIGNIGFAVGGGIASVTLLLSGIFYNEEDKKSVLDIIRSSVFFALILNIALVAVVIILAPQITALFVDNPGSNAGLITLGGLQLYAFCFIPSSLNTNFKNYYQGIERPKLTQVISVFQNFVFTAIYAFVFSKLFGLNGIWISFVCGETTNFIVMSIYVWTKSKIRGIRAEAYAYLPDGFGEDDNSIEMNITNVDDAISASNKSAEFCITNGQSRRISMLVGLSIEEIAMNILKHGCNDGKKHNISVKLKKKETGEWQLRVRDDCRNFDPVKYLELHTAGDGFAHIGIRMIFGLVKEANYVNSLGLNNLTLTL